MIRRPVACSFVLVFSLAGCGGAVVPTEDTSPPALPTGTVTIESVTRTASDARSMSLRVRVANGTPAPVFVYAEALRSRFDDAAKLLTVVMHEVPTPPTGTSADCHVRIPRLSTVAALGTADVDVRVSFPEASGVRVELGWSDRKLALLPSQKSLCVFDAETALEALERGVAVGVFPLASA